MCGIAGILSTEVGADLQSPLLTMQRALRHRGPDDAGLWQAASGMAGFAHTRLSILDLSAAGHQPMSSADGRFTITFNGEIYNFLELRASLERDGITFHTRTDTEVILRLYEKHGSGCVTHLRGMFAFAIWDEVEGSCFLARDRFGIKPLYVAEAEGRLVFASELQALLQSGMVERQTDSAALVRYFTTGSVPEPLTLVQGARMLEAGTSLVWKDGSSRQERWWRVTFPGPRPMSRAKAAAITRAALLDSVEHHFVSDVPVGLFLSGGIDSTALLALAHATGRRNLRTFSIGLEDPAHDESRLARRTAEHFGTEHTELKLTADKAREIFARFLDVVDQPTIDGFNTYTVAGLARDHGMKVVLSGLGGDELFGGYKSFQQVPRLVRLARCLGGLRGITARILERVTTAPRFRRLSGALREGGRLEQVYEAFRGIFSTEEAVTLARHFLEAEGGERRAEGNAGCRMQNGGSGTLSSTSAASQHLNGSTFSDGLGLSDAISALELTLYMRNQLLRDSDVMSMAHGLELRVPLVDSALFDAVSLIPASIRLHRDKLLLLDAVPEIPAWIRDSPKRGFLFPYEQWLATPEWQALFAARLRDLPVPATNWYQRWAVFVFKQWTARPLTSDLSSQSSEAGVG